MGDTGEIIACESRGDVRYLACDATAAYRGAAQRMVRHLVMVGEEGVVLVDDIVPARPATPVTAQYQAGGITELLADGRLLIHGQRATLRLEVLSPSACALTLHPERSLHDTHWGYHFAACRLFPVTLDFTAAEEVPLVTLLLDATTAQPGAAQLTLEGQHLLLRLPSGRMIAFGYRDGRWLLDWGVTEFSSCSQSPTGS